MDTEIQEERCPSCGCRTGIISYLVIRFSIVKWPQMLIFAGIVLVAADIVGLAVSATLGFAFLAIIPLLFDCARKRSCQVCGVDFSLPVSSSGE